MTSLLLAAYLSLLPAVADGQNPAPAVEGKWLIVYAEENSKRNNAWEQRVASIRGDTLTYQDGGQDRTLKLTFGANQTVTATPGGGKDKEKEAAALTGVYISGQDYLCLSLSAGKGDSKPKAAEVAQQKVSDDKASPPSSGNFILIMRRQRGS